MDFEYWFANIVAGAELIVSPNALPRAWVHGDKDITSAYDIDELLEQLLGDTHLPEDIPQFEERLRQIGALEPVTAFTQALLDMERIVSSDSHLHIPKNLFSSSAWEELREVAKGIAGLPAAKWDQKKQLEKVETDDF